MSMTSSVVGIKPPDGKWKKMKKVYDVCRESGVNIPSEVVAFFDGETPDDKGVVVELDDDPCVKEINGEMINGFEVDLTKLAADIKIIRFINSY